MMATQQIDFGGFNGILPMMFLGFRELGFDFILITSLGQSELIDCNDFDC